MNILFVILFINGHSSSGDSNNGHHTSNEEGIHISKIDWNTNGNSINKNMLVRVITNDILIYDIELLNSFKNVVKKTNKSYIYNIARFNNYIINDKKYRCLYYYKIDINNSDIIINIDFNTTYISHEVIIRWYCIVRYIDSSTNNIIQIIFMIILCILFCCVFCICCIDNNDYYYRNIKHTNRTFKNRRLL